MLSGLLEDGRDDAIPVSELGKTLEERAYGALLFLFGVPNISPIVPPGMTIVLGIPLVIIAAQLMAGLREPALPSWIGERTIPRRVYAAVAQRLIPILVRVEYLLRPRLLAMTTRAGERFIGAFLLVITVALALPIPFGNWLPALSVCIIALGLVERDGIVILIGMAVGIIALTAVAGVIWAGLKALGLLLANLPA